MKKIELSKALSQDAVQGIKHFFQQQRDEVLSDFQAAALLDFILDDIAPYIYNQALVDAHALMSERIEDLYGLQKYPGSSSSQKA